MPKTFITERDIDDMKTQGVTSFDVTDNIVLTDLAVERAMKHGIKASQIRDFIFAYPTFSADIKHML